MEVNEKEFSRFRLDLGKDVLDEILARYSPVGDPTSASVGRAVAMAENFEATVQFYRLMDSLLEYGNKNEGPARDAAFMVVNLAMAGAYAAKDTIREVLK